MKCLLLLLIACGKMLLLVTWVCYRQPQSYRGMLPLDLCARQVHGGTQKNTPRQDRALLRMVQQDRFISARALTAMRNLYGMRAGRKTINNRLLSCGFHAYRPTMKSLLTANHCHLCLERAHKLQKLTMAHWQHVIFVDESRFQLYLVDGRLRIRCLSAEHFQERYQA